MSSKRGPFSAHLGGSAEQPPATKRARVNLSASVLPGRFLPCHLVMLRSLYATDNKVSVEENSTAEIPTTKSSSVDNQVKEEVWHLIDVFLANRGDLATSRVKAMKSQAVYESAERILNEGTGGVVMKESRSSGNGVLGGQSSPVPSTPLLRTGKLSPGRSIGVGTTTPADIPMARQDHQNAHLQQNQNVNSWTLVTKLLGRKNAATQKDTERSVAEPYQPLMDALESKLKELHSTHKDILDEKSFADEDDDTGGAIFGSFDGMGEATCKRSSGGERQDSHLAHGSLEEEDVVAKLECKLYLWTLLLSSMRGVVG